MKNARKRTPARRVGPFFKRATLLLSSYWLGIQGFGPVQPATRFYFELNAHRPQLGLLSFDLDDTLFHTGKVVRSANEAMVQAMKDRGCANVTIPDFLATTRSIRTSLDNPTTYQDLRKLSIRKTFELSDTLDSNADLGVFVNDCYEAWLNERHAAAERFVFDDAIETLSQLRSLYPDACFAAITNGAGDPLAMPNTLAPFFDFRVSGEDADIFPYRKPHSFIYEYALQKYEETDSSSGVWCHVGDCLANDVGASAKCGARSIWMCLEKDEDSAASRLTDQKTPEWSTAPKQEMERRAKQVEEGRNAVSAKISSLSELPEVITLILEDSRELE